MKKAIGVIAEDESDVDVIKVFIEKIAGLDFYVERFLGRGCGRIKNKCRIWTQNLKEKGCSVVILVHDLDDNDHDHLQNDIYIRLSPILVKDYFICIPIREIEAWLLADEQAIRRAFHLTGELKRISNPESVVRPKEKLRDLINMKSEGKTVYVNTVHNKKIAKEIDLINLRRCSSFFSFENFIKSLFI